MRSRGPIYAMLTVGLLVIVALTLLPASLLREARQAVFTLLPGATHEADVAPAAPAAPPPFDVASFYAERGEELSRHGVLVESLDGSRVYASHNPDQLFNPASIIKLATSLAVLRRLGADHRFETRVYAEGERDEGARVLRGRVVLDGQDPVFGDVQAVLVSRELRARGVERVDGEVLVTPGFSFNFAEKPEDSVERAAKVMQLKERKTGVADAPPTGQPLFVVKSQTLREIILYMNAHSNNFVAEHLGARVGGPAGLRNFLVEELKLPPEQVVIQRASGREHNRMTARGVLVVVRALKEEAERQGYRLEDFMPVASDDSGTLRRRLEGTPLEGATLGKTGTLTAEVDGGMASLAGVVYTQPDGAIVYAIFDQGNRIAENRELEDILLAQVVSAHDTPRPINETEERRRLLSPESLVVEPEALGKDIEMPEPKESARDRDSNEEERPAERKKEAASKQQPRNARRPAATASRRRR